MTIKQRNTTKWVCVKPGGWYEPEVWRGRVSHCQPERKESHSEPMTPLGTGHPMMFKKLSGCGGSPRPRAHHDPPLVSAQARPEAGYSRPALLLPSLSIVSERFPWLSAISVRLHPKPLHYGLACIATFAVLAFAFSRTPRSAPPLLPHPLMFDFFQLALLLAHRNTEFKWVQSNAKIRSNHKKLPSLE